MVFFLTVKPYRKEIGGLVYDLNYLLNSRYNFEAKRIKELSKEPKVNSKITPNLYMCFSMAKIDHVT